MTASWPVAMPVETRPSCRLYVILARDGRSAAVFRRGPSRQVALLRWWLGTDRVELGQWFKGRIYERRSDLSPDGELLVYFAAKHKGPFGTWTAVSRPPFLEVLALWPKGDAWGGGGLFATGRRLGLNHPPHQMTLAAVAAPRLPIEVERSSAYAGGGEDNPLHHDRIIRDGWQLLAAGNASSYRQTGPARWVLDEPEVYAREQPAPRRARRGRDQTGPLTLHRELRAVGVTQGPWYREDFVVKDAAGRCLRLIADADWADWDTSGDLLVAAEGRLHRIAFAAVHREVSDPLADATRVADLAPLRFEPVEAPPEAGVWPSARAKTVSGRIVARPLAS